MPRRKRAANLEHDTGLWTSPRAEGDIALCTIETLRKIVAEKTALLLVWAEEGEFLPNGDWKFNEAHLPRTLGHTYEPLLMDLQSASLLVQMRDRLGDKPFKSDTHPHAGKYTMGESFDVRVAESRIWVGKFLDFAWGNASFK